MCDYPAQPTIVRGDAIAPLFKMTDAGIVPTGLQPTCGGSRYDPRTCNVYPRAVTESDLKIPEVLASGIDKYLSKDEKPVPPQEQKSKTHKAVDDNGNELFVDEFMHWYIIGLRKDGYSIRFEGETIHGDPPK